MSTSSNKKPSPEREVEGTSRSSRSVSGIAEVLTVEERRQAGRTEREAFPRSVHEEFTPDAHRPDPIGLLEEQGKDRLPDLIPIRYGRMLASPFAFFRGSAAIMAWDLSRAQHTSLNTQLCGDAHLANFGFFGSPERQLLFDMNDFDETHVGPWEWDVKRLAASAVLAGREQGLAPAASKNAALRAVRSYRERIAELSELTTLEIWYSHVTAASIVEIIDDPSRRKLAARRMVKARSRDSHHAVGKLTEVLGGKLRIKEKPPLIERLHDEEVSEIVQPIFRKYEESLQDDRRQLIEHFQYVDSARRVGGIGSVGTRCYIVVLTGRDVADPLVLQLKEASPSVLAPYLPPSHYRNEAQRVVEGQRLIQGTADLFLGWLRNANGREFYFRQLYNMKASVAIDEMNESLFTQYVGLCGELLARSHAKAGDPIAISAYLGKGDRFDHAIADFAVRYADQSERDFEALERAVRAGRVPAEMGI